MSLALGDDCEFVIGRKVARSFRLSERSGKERKKRITTRTRSKHLRRQHLCQPNQLCHLNHQSFEDSIYLTSFYFDHDVYIYF